MREIDPAWWRSAAFDTRPLHAYLRERDLGAVFRFLRSRGWSRSTIAAATGLSETRVREISIGRQRVTSYEVLERIAHGLSIDRGLLGIAYDDTDSALDGDESAAVEAAAESPADLDELELSVLSLPAPVKGQLPIQGLIDVLTDHRGVDLDHAPVGPPVGPPPALALPAPCEPTLGPVERATAGAKRNYQSCRYDAVLRDLPGLLGTLTELHTVTEHRRVDALAAHAYHVAGSVLLKVGEPSLASIAADRSMTAAQRSGDPITVAASARIVTHTLMSTGHNERARYVAITAADELVREVSLRRSEPARSVYGALLLRASVASASIDNETTQELLDAAATVARTLAADANVRWTAFGATNVLLHRVSVALVRGDAGSAIRTARKVDLGTVTLAERKASLFLDVARAFQQCGRHDDAFDALDVAHRTAPEEIRSRPAAERLVIDLATTAPRSTSHRVRRLAASAGITV